MNVKALVAEFIGTFMLIFIGAGAGAMGTGGLVGVAFAHGGVVLGGIYAFGHISGTHINPAVTFGMWVGKQIGWATAVCYWIVQLMGGILGAFALRYFLGGVTTGLGATVLAPAVSPVQGLLLEMILTFFLVNAIFNTAVSGKAGNLAPVAISFTLIACILMGAPLTGASLNPARTLGPALATGNFAHLWLYILGPMAGAAAAAWLFTGFLQPGE